MIVEDTGVGRFSFFLDINSGEAFRPEKYVPNHDEFNYEPIRKYALEQAGGSLTSRFEPIRQWLEFYTYAARVLVVIMADAKRPDCPEINAVMVELPEPLAPMFKLFWYGG